MTTEERTNMLKRFERVNDTCRLLYAQKTKPDVHHQLSWLWIDPRSKNIFKMTLVLDAQSVEYWTKHLN
jgi:hypothetical protein